MPARFAELGDVHAAIDDQPVLDRAHCSSGTTSDERGDMPYPPNYPKMPGEPKRVQPSKARDDTE